MLLFFLIRSRYFDHQAEGAGLEPLVDCQLKKITFLRLPLGNT